MKKIAILSMAVLFSTTFLIAGGKGEKKCCKKNAKECTEKTEAKTKTEEATK